MKKKLLKGFTLVELVVVMILMGIMTTMIVMVMRPAQNTYTNITCKAYEEQTALIVSKLINSELRYSTGIKIICNDGTNPIAADCTGYTRYIKLSNNYRNYNATSPSSYDMYLKGARGYVEKGTTNGTTWTRESSAVTMKTFDDYDFQFSIEGFNNSPGQETLTLGVTCNFLRVGEDDEIAAATGIGKPNPDFIPQYQKVYKYSETFDFINLKKFGLIGKQTLGLLPDTYEYGTPVALLGDSDCPYYDPLDGKDNTIWILYIRPDEAPDKTSAPGGGSGGSSGSGSGGSSGSGSGSGSGNTEQDAPEVTDDPGSTGGGTGGESGGGTGGETGGATGGETGGQTGGDAGAITGGDTPGSNEPEQPGTGENGEQPGSGETPEQPGTGEQPEQPTSGGGSMTSENNGDTWSISNVSTDYNSGWTYNGGSVGNTTVKFNMDLSSSREEIRGAKIKIKFNQNINSFNGVANGNWKNNTEFADCTIEGDYIVIDFKRAQHDDWGDRNLIGANSSVDFSVQAGGTDSSSPLTPLEISNANHLNSVSFSEGLAPPRAEKIPRTLVGFGGFFERYNTFLIRSDLYGFVETAGQVAHVAFAVYQLAEACEVGVEIAYLPAPQHCDEYSDREPRSESEF